MSYLMPQTSKVAEQVKVLTITQHAQFQVANEINLQPFVPNKNGFCLFWFFFWCVWLVFFKQSQKLPWFFHARVQFDTGQISPVLTPFYYTQEKNIALGRQQQFGTVPRCAWLSCLTAWLSCQAAHKQKTSKGRKGKADRCKIAEIGMVGKPPHN